MILERKLRPDADAHPELCRVDGCERVVECRGVCATCYICIRYARLEGILLAPWSKAAAKRAAKGPRQRPGPKRRLKERRAEMRVNSWRVPHGDCG